MPQIEPSKQPNRAPLVLAVVCVLVVVGIVGALMLWKTMPKQEQLTTQQALDKANDAVFSEKYTVALKTLEDQLPKAKTVDEKVRLQTNIGVVYARQANYAKALQAFQEARKLKETYGTIKSVADMAVKAGNKELALSSYKLLEKRITDGTYKQQAMDLSQIKEAISQLGSAK